MLRPRLRDRRRRGKDGEALNPLDPTPFQALWIDRFATLADFAAAVDVGVPHLSELGRGNRNASPALAHRIAAALSTPKRQVSVRKVLEAVKQTRKLAESSAGRKRRKRAA